MKTQYFKLKPNLFSFTIFLISAFLLLNGLNCKKENLSGLPRITTNGANTMGFLLNGKPWRNHSDDFKISSTSAHWDKEELEIRGVNSDVSEILFVLNNLQVGIYNLNTKTGVYYTPYNLKDEFTFDYSNSENRLEITRYDNQIISGEFTLTFKSPSGEIIKLTSGRFDIKISPY